KGAGVGLVCPLLSAIATYLLCVVVVAEPDRKFSVVGAVNAVLDGGREVSIRSSNSTTMEMDFIDAGFELPFHLFARQL
ncbi:MAG TPA: hypothetical protein VGR56_00265, partial [Nitrososphaerales archaeon]|nr:hypothetical protein [Nitrososphaerales archaeon]